MRHVAITSFSQVPLQLATSLGFLLAGISLIGIIGEYLSRIYDEVRARPLYIVRTVLESEGQA